MADTKLQIKLPVLKKDAIRSNKRLFILLGILVVLSVVAIVVNVLLKDSSPPEIPVTQGQLDTVDLTKDLVQVLPQLERAELFPDEEIDSATLKTVDPFALPMELLGIVSGGEGSDLAIIKARQTTYIVSSGEEIAGTWEVLEINRNSVRLKGDTKEIIVELSSRD